MTADRLVVFSPLPPTPNGIADYAAELLPHHMARYRCTLVVADEAPDPALPGAGDVQVLRLTEYLRARTRLVAHKHLYHVGNNPDHAYMLPVLLHTPGVVVVHDVGLHYLHDVITLARGNRDGYIASLTQQYGRRGATVARLVLESRWKGRSIHDLLRCNRTIASRAQAMIVHSLYAASQLSGAAAGAPIRVVPHHLSPKAADYPRKMRHEWRRALDIPAGCVLLTSLGFINASKQTATVLKTLARLRERLPPFLYVLAGEPRPLEYDVEADIRRLGLADCVRVTGYTNEDQFFRHIVVSDLILNLRYPTGGESSGTLTRAMGLGRCCVVVDIGPFAEIPDDAAVKIPWSGRFAADLEAALERLISDAPARAGYEAAAMRHAAAVHDIARSAARYHDVIDAIRPPLEHPLCYGGGLALGTVRFSYLSSSALARRLDSDRELQAARRALRGTAEAWWRERWIPQRAPGVRLGVIAQHREVSIVLERAFGWRQEELAASLADECDVLLVHVPFAKLHDDPFAFLARAASRVRLGGFCVLAVWRQDPASTEPLDVSAAGVQPQFTVDYLREVALAAGFETVSAVRGSGDFILADDFDANDKANDGEISLRLRRVSDYLDPPRKTRGKAARRLVAGQRAPAPAAP